MKLSTITFFNKQHEELKDEIVRANTRLFERINDAEFNLDMVRIQDKNSFKKMADDKIESIKDSFEILMRPNFTSTNQRINSIKDDIIDFQKKSQNDIEQKILAMNREIQDSRRSVNDQLKMRHILVVGLFQIFCFLAGGFVVLADIHTNYYILPKTANVIELNGGTK